METLFVKNQELLQSYLIKPAQIKKFNKKFDAEELIEVKRRCLGVFISSLIQVSYNQGFNDFEFEQVDADYFGAFLKGKKDNPIRIKAKKVWGDELLHGAKYCSLIAKELNTIYTLQDAVSCSLQTEYFISSEYLGYCCKDCVIKIG
ncbi:hypothetical protein HY643_00650 [Candidatus Woesearchaeota archaeon]|nr:hypothetical protein [Candidatus Woesearchaeota archaeon]